MKKKLIFGAIILLGVALALLFIFSTKKAQFAAMAEAGASMVPPPVSVSTFIASEQVWEESLQAIGSIEPVQGVALEAEIPGIVSMINFENGQFVNAGDLMVQLDIKVEQAQLRAAEASARLAVLENERAKKLRESGSVPQSQLDSSSADVEKANAEVDNFKAIISRKTIRAPFSGKVGIRQINLGQYVAQGASIVTLQADEQVFVNFTLPQHALSKLSTGMEIALKSDAYPDKTFTGAITAISPQIDSRTRTIQLQGTLDNPDGLLRAGLFVRVEAKLPTKQTVLVVPSTAINYAPYGNSIYKVIEKVDEASGESQLIAEQHFIRIGKHKGDFVSVVDGMNKGDEVVSAGAFKLQNGATVMINNDLKPTAELNPNPDNT
ncbi:MAG: efflux RND transporter periplasmic adaptor subunit [Opitutales bacterium]|nr:efflux RND transporter periplasmic adaptor subunit [Opitutales bacterium]MDP4694309.1 efflux RND transporter periplasmic adaptor subunit [Opitutales bacterium]MDP4884415.1 efflux RND transporter periplasmic adaptor subunit [Opitutales bacterium]MDP5079333.1 efflux RND transporter periplasmic adaptor subunit [Opitutales bacterium]